MNFIRDEFWTRTNITVDMNILNGWDLFGLIRHRLTLKYINYSGKTQRIGRPRNYLFDKDVFIYIYIFLNLIYVIIWRSSNGELWHSDKITASFFFSLIGRSIFFSFLLGVERGRTVTSSLWKYILCRRQKFKNSVTGIALDGN